MRILSRSLLLWVLQCLIEQEKFVWKQLTFCSNFASQGILIISRPVKSHKFLQFFSIQELWIKVEVSCYSSLTLQMFIACRGIPVLVGFLEADYAKYRFFHCILSFIQRKCYLVPQINYVTVMNHFEHEENLDDQGGVWALDMRHKTD